MHQMMRTAMRVLLVTLLVGLWPVDAWARWTRVTSANFVFVGDAPGAVIREVAERLEQFRETLLQALPSAAGQSPVPTIVIVFANERTMAPFRPLFRGRPVDVGGYFQGGEDVNYMAVNADFLDFALPSIFHEYSHFLLANGFGRAPAWVSEGLAELYQVMEPRNGGKSVLIGRAPGAHVELLKASTLMSIADLTTVDRQSSVYNEGNRRSVFYAQSWALVHYLTLGNPARTPQFRDYLAGLRAGTPSAEALRDAFGADAATLERELFEYVRRFAFPALQINFAQRAAATDVGRGVTIPDIEADVYLGDLQVRMDRLEDGRARLEGVLKKNPNAGRATAALGLIEMRAGRGEAAATLLETAATQAPDDADVLVALGRTLVARMQSESGEQRQATNARARAALARAVETDQASGFALALLGYLELDGDGDAAQGASALERAVRLAPAREEWRVMLARALIRSAQYDKAATTLGPLMAAGSTSEVRDTARRLMTEAVERRQPPTAAPAPVANAAPATAVPLTPPTSSPALPDAAASRPERTAADGRVTLDLRKVLAGETRVRGVFRSIECAGGVATLVIDSNGRVVRLRARQLAQVDFISYRPDPPASVNCGPLSPAPVIATYRADPAGADQPDAVLGDAVAIELLPDDWREAQ